jgi:Macrocin-O-methyltransferase (TylF)
MNSSGTWDAYNDLLLWGPLDRFTKMWARYELFKQVIDLPGDIVEGGVFKGAGLLYWAKLIQVFNPLSRRRVVGFDTFAGYPKSTSHEYDRVKGEEFLKASNYEGGSPEAIMAIAREVGLESRVEIIKGDAGTTMEQYVQKNPGFRVALMNLDFDTYDPTAAALKHFYPLVIPNGVIVFDEYAAREWGESNAVDEYFKGKNLTFRAIPWALSPGAYVVKRPDCETSAEQLAQIA